MLLARSYDGCSAIHFPHKTTLLMENSKAIPQHSQYGFEISLNLLKQLGQMLFDCSNISEQEMHLDGNIKLKICFKVVFIIFVYPSHIR